MQRCRSLLLLLARSRHVSRTFRQLTAVTAPPQAPGCEEILQAMLSYKLAQDEKLLAQVVIE